MILTVEDMIKTLRNGVNVTDSEGVEDPAYSAMSDEDLLLFIKMAVSRDYPDIEDLADLPNGSEYGIILLAKIELYMKLAVIMADQFDMGADNNNYLKRSQRFNHYMKLAEEARTEYENYVADASSGGLIGSGGVQTYDLLLASRHYTARNYNLSQTPVVKLKFGQVTNNSVEILWSVTKSDFFGRYKVYLSEKPIVDMFRDGAKLENKLNEGAKLYKSTNDIRDCYHRIVGLEPDKTYYIAVFSQERNGIFGYSEKSFTTLSLVDEEENVSVDTL